MNRLPSMCRFSAQEPESDDNSSSTNSCVDPFPDITIIDRHQKIDGESEGTESKSKDNDTTTVTHIIVLIHGWMGNPAEMGYIRESIQNAATRHKAVEDKEICHKFVIHSASCNEDRTDDGIAVGGSRIAEEINSLVRYIVNGGDGRKIKKDDGHADQASTTPKNSKSQFTMSIIGNSLGGLYGRHALAGINWNIGESSTLIPMCFVTTATPHLGISQHTYVPLPRAAEYVVAHGMKETGKDFFRFTPVLEDLFHKDYFINPLSKFHERIAYINVYGTDFQVPTATAAFWAPGSDSVHHRIPTTTAEESTTMVTKKDGAENETTETETMEDASLSSFVPSVTPKAIVMMLSTPQRLDNMELKQEEEGKATVEEEKKDEKPAEDKKDPAQEYLSWSKRLDGLGWTKVLVDVRDEVPEIPVPVGEEEIETTMDESKKDEDGDADNDIKADGDDSDHGSESDKKEQTDEQTKDDIEAEDANSKLAQKDTWTAGELLAQFKGGLMTANKKRRSSLWGLKPRIPLGHTVMIANAKDEFNKKVTSGGKPVMDYLGASMVLTLTSKCHTEVPLMNQCKIK